MKVCMIGHFPPHLGGIASYVYLLSQALVERGDEVYVITYPSSKKVNDPSIHVEFAPTPSIKGLRGFFFTITATWKLIRMVQSKEIDLIHAHYLMPPGLVAILAGLLTRKKVFITLHGSDVFLLSTKKILKPIYNFILKQADEVFVVSESLKEELLKTGLPEIKHKLKITWNGVDVDKFNPEKNGKFKNKMGIPQEKPIVLFVGNLVQQKGVKYLLKAKKYIKKPVIIVIVGGGPLIEDLKAMKRQEKIEDVIFTGPLDDISQVLPDAEILVLPSLSESFGIALLEAMASGKPVVATKVGGIPELVDDDVGILVEPRDPVSLAKAIDFILSNKNLKQNMSIKAREKALKYAHIEVPY